MDMARNVAWNAYGLAKAWSPTLVLRQSARRPMIVNLIVPAALINGRGAGAEHGPRRLTEPSNTTTKYTESIMPAQTRLFLCLKDNFGVLVHDPGSGATAAIDAPEAAPIEAALKATGWRLSDILVTHHHADHTGGIEELKARHHCRVVAPDAEADGIPGVDETVRQNDKVRVGGLEAQVIETPGHTAGHISYFFPTDKLVFVGDTLFSIGCGRVIEGNPQMMWDS
jgi:glyoxylase-like metal-dependent hydrolase (beta-lactamase superfamily II)